MNTSRRITRFPVALVASLMAILLLGSLAPTVSAQTTPGSRLATQFFLSLSGTPTAYVLSPDALLHTPQGDYTGQDGLGDFRTDLEASFSHIQYLAGDAVQVGDLVMVSFTLTAVHTGTFQGLAANCAGITVDGVAALKTEQRTYFLGQADQDHSDASIEQTVVVEQWIDYDRDQIASQISAVNLMDPADGPGCAEPVVALAQDAGDELPPTTTLPPAFRNDY